MKRILYALTLTLAESLTTAAVPGVLSLPLRAARPLVLTPALSLALLAAAAAAALGVATAAVRASVGMSPVV